MSTRSSRPAREVAGAKAAPPGKNVTKHAGRPHLFALVWGAVDARINHLDYFDTSGGDEVRRLFRQRRVSGGDGRGPRRAGRARARDAG